MKLSRALTPTWIRDLFFEMYECWKDSGTRGLLRRYGWKLLVAVFLFYLIRDSILYILIPYLIYAGLIA